MSPSQDQQKQNANSSRLSRSLQRICSTHMLRAFDVEDLEDPGEGEAEASGVKFCCTSAPAAHRATPQQSRIVPQLNWSSSPSQGRSTADPPSDRSMDNGSGSDDDLMSDLGSIEREAIALQDAVIAYEQYQAKVNPPACCVADAASDVVARIATPKRLACLSWIIWTVMAAFVFLRVVLLPRVLKLATGPTHARAESTSSFSFTACATHSAQATSATSFA